MGHGQNCTVQCNPGYDSTDSQGSSSFFECDRGIYVAFATCTARMCERTAGPGETTAEGETQSAAFDTSLTVSCATGYFLVGDVSELACVADSNVAESEVSFSASAECQKKSCADLPVVSDGSFADDCGDAVYGDECMLTCSNGFKINDQDAVDLSISCTVADDAQTNTAVAWDAEPACEAVQCTLPTGDAFQQTSDPTINAGSSYAGLTCAPGYSTDAADSTATVQTAVCTASGATGQLAYDPCVELSCSALSTISAIAGSDSEDCGGDLVHGANCALECASGTQPASADYIDVMCDKGVLYLCPEGESADEGGCTSVEADACVQAGVEMQEMQYVSAVASMDVALGSAARRLSNTERDDQLLASFGEAMAQVLGVETDDVEVDYASSTVVQQGETDTYTLTVKFQISTDAGPADFDVEGALTGLSNDDLKGAFEEKAADAGYDVTVTSISVSEPTVVTVLEPVPTVAPAEDDGGGAGTTIGIIVGVLVVVCLAAVGYKMMKK